jgi:hypothetical protein
MHTVPPETSTASVLTQLEELKRIQLERERLDAREAVSYENLAAALAKRRPGTLPISAPPVVARVHGIGDRLIELLRERPDADRRWLVVQAYGSDSPENRRRLSSTTNYLRRKGKLVQPAPRGPIVTK